MSLRNRNNKINYSDTRRNKKKSASAQAKVKDILVEHGLDDHDENKYTSFNLQLVEESNVEEKGVEENLDEENGVEEKIDEEARPSQQTTFPDLRNNAFKYLSKQLPFKKIRSFESEAEYDEYIRTEFPLIKCKKSHKQGCSECSQRKSGHHMRIKRLVCECNHVECGLEFKVHKCDESNRYHLYLKGYDIHSHKEILKGDVTDNATKKEKINSSGVHIAYKQAIIKILDEDVELTAKKILIRLNKRKDELKLPFHLMPSLAKVKKVNLKINICYNKKNIKYAL